MTNETLQDLDLELAELVESLAELGDTETQPLLESGLRLKNSNDVIL
ncbi:hypothetical protein ACTG9Q_15360 [Actinokineospora sp. 24-640]